MKNQELERSQYTNLQLQSVKQNKLIGEWITTREESDIANTMTEKRIGQFDRQDMGQIVELLANWRLMLGVTADSTPQELVFITQFIYDNYKHLTLTDLNFAKNYSITGKIDVGFVTQKTFSSYYIAKCLNAYDSYKREVINEIDRKKERYEARKTIENPLPISAEDEANSFKDYLVALYQSFKEQREFYDIGDIFYNWAKKIQLIQPSGADIQNAWQYADKRLRESDSMAKTINNSLMEGSKENYRKKYARHYIILNMFEKYTLGDLISKIHPSQFQK